MEVVFMASILVCGVAGNSMVRMPFVSFDL